jgi:2-oxoglutarate dehydrogenase E2 component (dihydrolipoamide succinyltransferase)
MPTNVEIPALGESVSEAVLVKWHKEDGEQVEANEPLCELETDKANVDLPAPAAGVLSRICDEGDTVHIGEVVARIDESAAAGDPKKKPQAKAERSAQATKQKQQDSGQKQPQPESSARPEDLSPAVRTMVSENKLDPQSVPGTGRGGRITKEDVQRVLNQRPAPPPARETQEQQPAPELDAEDETATSPLEPMKPPPGRPATAAINYDQQGTRRVAMSKIRRRIAERLVTAQQTAAILTTFNEIDLKALLDLRARYKERFSEVHNVSLGLMSFFCRAIVLALREFPRVNAFIDGDDVIYHEYVHLGIAVSTERGLAVPVLRNAESLSFAQVESEIKRLATATREGKLGLQELSGGTFTITNGGVFGSLLSTPILNPPQSGILGMHAIQKRPVVIEDRIEIRPMMYVALSYDHRLVDGRESVSFLVRVKEYLEDPARLMLEI